MERMNESKMTKRKQPTWKAVLDEDQVENVLKKAEVRAERNSRVCMKRLI